MNFYLGRKTETEDKYEISFVSDSQERAIEAYRSEAWARGKLNLILLVEVPVDISTKAQMIYNPIEKITETPGEESGRD